MKLSRKAYAKINLFLDVLDKREDGYHNIGTLFQQIGIFDTLHGELLETDSIELSCTKEVTGTITDNLIYKAAVALKAHSGCTLGARLFLEKRLPSGAGLGGGSADAAATFNLLNELWNLHLSPEELEKISAPLGADIPFMIQGGTRFGEGIGDRLYAAPAPETCTLLIVTPEAFVSTADAYASLSPSGNARYISFKSHYLKSNGAFKPEPSLIYNKFEESILPKFPIIAEVKQHMLESKAIHALLSGSGASIFGLFEDKPSAENCLKTLKTANKFSAITNFIY